MKKRIKLGILISMILILGLTSCNKEKESIEKEVHKKAFYGTFDTQILYLSYTNSEEQFKEEFKIVEDEFNRLHKLYDRYNSYDGVNNVKTINDKAGLEAVKVDKDLFDVIKFSIDNYDKSLGKVNIALGPVLNLWHDVRKENEDITDDNLIKLPDEGLLRQASKYTDINKVIVDEDKQTIYLEDKNMSLDLGAVAKGYAAELVALKLEEEGVDSASINAGGNIRTIGSPADGRKNWGIAIEHPLMGEADDYLEVLFVGQTSVVTSGDYQRYFSKDDIKYHHIVDPFSLQPETIYNSVSIITKDSGLADYLSTAFFLADEKETEILLENYKDENIEVLWYENKVGKTNTPGLEKYMKSKGAQAK